MGIETLLFGRTHAELRDVSGSNDRLSALRRSMSRQCVNLTARVEELELDSERVAMVARPLAEMRIAKGLLTSEDLARQLHETDFVDGVGDGRLDPKLVEPGRRGLAKLEPIAAGSPPFKLEKPIVRKKKTR